MADYIELANSYYRLLRWVEATDAEKKNTALRSLDKIKRFLTDSSVEVIDLTGQPFSEGWAVKVMKLDDTVPENELVFTRMVKPIIQINGELAQDGEVYVGRLEAEDNGAQAPVAPEENRAAEAAEAPAEPDTQTNEEAPAAGSAAIQLIKKLAEKVKALPVTGQQWICGGFAAAVLVIFILVACTLGGQSGLRSDVAAVDGKVDGLALSDYHSQTGEAPVVTYEIRSGDSTIVVTQPIGENAVSVIDIGGVPVTLTTGDNKKTAEGE